jgi:hypothetical protein
LRVHGPAETTECGNNKRRAGSGHVTHGAQRQAVATGSWSFGGRDSTAAGLTMWVLSAMMVRHALNGF